MAVGDLVTGDWEAEYRGFAFGGDSSDFLIAPGITGLADNPAIDTSDRNRLRRHGRHPGDDFYADREIIIPIEITGADTDDWESNLKLLKTAMVTDPDAGEDWLVFQFPGIAEGGKRRIRCRPRGLAVPLDLEWYYEIPIVSTRWVSTKPWIYDDTLTEVITGILTPSSTGLTWPLTWPLSWGESSATSLNTTNSGNAPAEWTAIIPGPVTNPVIQHVGQSRTLTFTITLAAGEYLEVDSDARTVLLNGTASRYSTKSGDWFALDPGTNELSYRADSGTSTMTLSYRSTWS